VDNVFVSFASNIDDWPLRILDVEVDIVVGCQWACLIEEANLTADDVYVREDIVMDTRLTNLIFKIPR
jgi:hypothetical protein